MRIENNKTFSKKNKHPKIELLSWKQSNPDSVKVDYWFIILPTLFAIHTMYKAFTPYFFKVLHKSLFCCSLKCYFQQLYG